MEEKYRHFLFGIVASVGLCFIILVFFTGDEALKDNPTLSKILCKWQGLIKNGNTPVKKYSKLINC